MCTLSFNPLTLSIPPDFLLPPLYCSFWNLLSPSPPFLIPHSTTPLIVNTATTSIFKPGHDMPSSSWIFHFFLYRSTAAFHSIDDHSSKGLPHSSSNGNDDKLKSLLVSAPHIWVCYGHLLYLLESRHPDNLVAF